MEAKQNRGNIASRRGSPVFVAIAVALAILVGLPILIPQATYADNISIDISQSDSVYEIQAKIQAAIDDCPAGDSVIVTGSRTDASEQLKLQLPESVTVVWRARYSGEVTGVENDDSSDNTSLLSLTGDCGIFEVAEGGLLVGEGNSAAIEVAGSSMRVNINGGTVSAVSFWAIIATGPGADIEVYAGRISSGWAIITRGAHSCVRVWGGSVEASDECTIYSLGGNSTVSVEGGTVRNSCAYGQAIYSPSDTVVSITGGTVSACGNMPTVSASYVSVSGAATVEATGSGSAIKAVRRNAVVNISGGIVSARQGWAIHTDDHYSHVYVMGGFIFAYGIITSSPSGTDLRDVIMMASGQPELSGNSIVCAWDQSAGRTGYSAGSQIDLTFSAADGSAAEWGRSGSKNGITYSGTPGFYQVFGVRVNLYLKILPWFAMLSVVAILSFVAANAFKRREKIRASSTAGGKGVGVHSAAGSVTGAVSRVALFVATVSALTAVVLLVWALVNS